MIRARGLLFGGACFATLAGFTVAVSSTATLPRATTARTADRAGAAGSARVDAAAASAPNSRADVAGGETTSAFVGVRGTSESGARLSAANVPLIPTQTVSGVSPNAGASGAGGEQKVVITGSGFTGATDVFFGGTDVSSASSYPCLSSPLGCFTVVSDTEIDADTPVETAGTVDVTVDTGTVNPPQDQYSYFDPPTVGNVASPQHQVATGVAVTGTNFSFPGVSPFASGVSEVDLVPTGGGSTVALTAVCSSGGQANCFAATSDTALTINLPNSMTAGQYDTQVITPGGTSAASSNDLLVVLPPAPTLTTLNLSSGTTAGGGNVILTGANFTGATDVHWGALDINTCGTGTCFTINTDTQITVDNIPAHGAGGVLVTVTTPSGTSGSKTYTYVTPAPTLTTLNPSSGSTAGGNPVVLTGTNFTGATDVNWGSTDIQACGTGICFTFNSDTQITVNNIPSNGAGGVLVTVTTGNGTSGSKTYTYVIPAPTLTTLNPTSGSTVGGNSVVLIGTNFTGATDVHVGTIDLTPCPSAPCFVVNTDIQITVTMPAETPGNVNVNVTTPGGTTTSLPYTYVAPAPTVTGVSPHAGAPAGGNTVTLTGSGFEAAGTPITSQVTVGSAPAILATPCVTSPTAPCFTVNSATSITIEGLPPGSGMVHITVTTPGGTSTMTSADVYTYVTTFPNVTTVSPKFGAATGNAYVTVGGSNFGDPSQGFGATDVVFGTKDIPAANTFPCPGSLNGCFEQIGTGTLGLLDVYTPAVAAGTVDIKVITPGGTSNVGVGDQYTFVAKGAYTAVSPFRICDTRPAGGGITPNQCDGAGKGTLVPGRETITVQITGTQIPAGAQAVVANISVINHGSGSTFVTAFPAGASQPLAANINLAGKKVESNLVIVQLSSSGQINIFNSVGSADVIVDLEGYFAAPGGSAGAFHSIPPLRICDSRAGTHTECAGTTSTPLQGGAWRRVVLSGVPPGTSLSVPHIPADGTAAAAAFNLTGTAASAATYLSVTAPTGSDACPTKAPAFANLNPTPGISLPNRVISNLGPNQDICLFSAAGSINFIIDVNGWFGNGHETTTGGFFYSVPPTRICDTRPSDGTRCQGQQLTANHSQVVAVAGIVAVPAWNSHAPPPLAVVANLTGIAGSAATYLTLYPSDVTPHPNASDLNPSAGQVIGDLAITSLAQTGSTVGNDNLYNAVGTINAVLDVAGWFQ